MRGIYITISKITCSKKQFYYLTLIIKKLFRKMAYKCVNYVDAGQKKPEKSPQTFPAFSVY